MQTQEREEIYVPQLKTNHPLKILMLTSSYPKYPGDVTAPFIESIAQFSREHGHEVTVLMPYHPDLNRQANERGVKLHQFRYTLPEKWHIWGYAASMQGDVKLRKLVYFLLPFVLVTSFWKMWQLTAKEKYDVIQAHWVIPNAPVAALVGWLRRIPVVISMHGSDVYIAEKLRPVGVVAGWAFRRAAGVTACSPDLRTRAQKLGAATDPTKSVVIPYGADPNVFKTPELPTQIIRQQLGFAPSEMILFCSGRLVYKKGFEYAIRAMPEVLKRVPTARLVIAGAGDLLDELKSIAQQEGVAERVRFEGSVAHNQIPDYLAACDIYLLPSVVDDSGNVDGLPNALLEALAAGRPVVASNVAGVPLAVEDGVNGRLVAQRDVAGLAKAIAELLADPMRREQFGKAARRKIEQELNWPTVAAHYSQVFENAVFDNR